METVELIIKVSISLFNAIALGFVLILVSRWHRRMEDKLNEIREYTRRVSECNRFIYINQLEWLKSAMINEERYEEAAAQTGTLRCDESGGYGAGSQY